MPKITPLERPDMMVFQAAQAARFMALDYGKPGFPSDVSHFLEGAKKRQDNLLEGNNFDASQRGEILEKAEALFLKAIDEQKKTGAANDQVWAIVNKIAKAENPAATLPGM